MPTRRAPWTGRHPLTCTKGASIVRRIAALIGGTALCAGMTGSLTRFVRGTVMLDDIAGC